MHSHPRLPCNGLFTFAPGLCSVASRHTFLFGWVQVRNGASVCFVNCISKGLIDILKAGSGEDSRNWHKTSWYVFSNRMF